MVMQATLVFLSLGLTMVAHGYVHSGRDGKPTDLINQELIQQEISSQKELANRLLHRLMDVAYETFKDLGGSEPELKEIQRKRALITTCYFQAVSCY